MDDTVGQTVIAWKVSNLKPSTDTVPGLPVYGDLWEANAWVKAVQGTITPQIPNLNAVAPNQAAYRVLWQAATPQGISGATIPQGESAKGKVYFDVTGPPPTTVTLNNGMEDLIIWTP
jgi:hypothetical protein